MVVTRFAPSPTGYLHIGGLRTALLNWLWARKNGGKFLLRVEDTDQNRHNEDAVNAIMNAFKWVGMESDDETVRQSERTDIYKKYIQQLLDSGKAYRCYMSQEELSELRAEQESKKERPRYDGRYRDFTGTPPENIKPVIRIKAPQTGSIFVYDEIKGRIEFRVEDTLDDFIIARADGSATYNFVVVIDDHLMGVNEIIRGDDHLSNTPKQQIIYDALNFKLPNFYHVPMIHNENGKKLSKRDGATDVMEYEKLGYFPEAILGFLIRLGWSHGDQEIFTIEEMKEFFEPKNISKSASIYSKDKLNWINSEFLKRKSEKELVEKVGGSVEMVSLVKDRCSTLIDLKSQVEKISKKPTEYDPKSVKKHFKEINQNLLKEFLKKLHENRNCENSFNETLKENEVGMAKLAQPIRIALVGNAQSPSVVDVMKILGSDEVFERVENLIKTIS